jgi:transcriptional regulator with PAS, ATPase and Fis domain
MAYPAHPSRDQDGERLSSVQRNQIERVLRQTGGNKAEAARQLGISRRALYRWIDKLTVCY